MPVNFYVYLLSVGLALSFLRRSTSEVVCLSERSGLIGVSIDLDGGEVIVAVNIEEDRLEKKISCKDVC